MMHVSFVLFYFIVFLHCYWLPIYCQIKANSSADTLPDLVPVCSPFSHHILIHILPNPLELSFLPLFLPVTSDLLSCKSPSPVDTWLVPKPTLKDRSRVGLPPETHMLPCSFHILLILSSFFSQGTTSISYCVSPS